MKNKKIDIYFFTGTGNTYLAAKKASEIFQKNDCIVTVKDITKTDPTNVNLLNTIGICFPVACWNTFPIVRSFIDNMPESNGTEVFVISTMGGSTFNTAANFGNILSNKGYSLIGTQNFLMPNNFIHVQQKEEKNAIKRENAYRKIEDFVKDLLARTKKGNSINLFSKISSIISGFTFMISNFIINRWKSPLFQKIIKFHIIKNKCIKCGLCIDICPVKNISSSNGYPVFDGKKCQLCMKCISYCPSKSIKSFFVNKTYKALSNIEEIK